METVTALDSINNALHDLGIYTPIRHAPNGYTVWSMQLSDGKLLQADSMVGMISIIADKFNHYFDGHDDPAIQALYDDAYIIDGDD